MSNIAAALEALTEDLRLVLGNGVLVTRDPGKVAANVASAGVAILVGPGVPVERSSYRTWFIEVPVSVVFPAPGEPRQLDPAYAIAEAIIDSDAAGFVSMDAGTINLDQATTLPSLSVTLRVTTDC